jgi:phosphoribosylformylglycinamidine cyclo-ligase
MACDGAGTERELKRVAARLSYKSAGVDIDLKDRLIPLFRKLARPTVGGNVLAGIGGFGALVGLDGFVKLRQPVLVAGTDGVGTKVKIAFATGRHDTIGIDCVAMCVNDIVCHNARPLFFLDYLSFGELDERIAIAIVDGLAQGCKMAGLSLVGGETAQMPGLYRRGEYDLAGFAVGVAARAKIPQPDQVRAGNVIVGLASSGLHSNGFALARKVLLERAKLKLNSRVGEFGCTLAEEMLRPTRIYAKIATELFRRFKVRGLANITGGGLPENLPRVMPKNLRAEIRRDSWPTLPIFAMIAKLGKISQQEIDRTFNNGIGMVAIVDAADADPVVSWLRRRRQAAFIIGEVRRGTRAVKFV